MTERRHEGRLGTRTIAVVEDAAHLPAGWTLNDWALLAKYLG